MPDHSVTRPSSPLLPVVQHDSPPSPTGSLFSEFSLAPVGASMPPIFTPPDAPGTVQQAIEQLRSTGVHAPVLQRASLTPSYHSSRFISSLPLDEDGAIELVAFIRNIFVASLAPSAVHNATPWPMVLEADHDYPEQTEVYCSFNLGPNLTISWMVVPTAAALSHFPAVYIEPGSVVDCSSHFTLQYGDRMDVGMRYRVRDTFPPL